MLSKGGRLTHWTTDTEPRPTRSMALKTMKQQTQVKTLSAGEENKTAQLKARRVGERPPVAAPAPTEEVKRQAHMNLAGSH